VGVIRAGFTEDSDRRGDHQGDEDDERSDPGESRVSEPLHPPSLNTSGEYLWKPDGVAKVTIRDYWTGRLWESAAGSVTIDKSEEYGWVYAGLGASAYSPVDVELNIAGLWSCSYVWGTGDPRSF